MRDEPECFGRELDRLHDDRAAYFIEMVRRRQIFRSSFSRDCASSSNTNANEQGWGKVVVTVELFELLDPI